MAESFFPSIGSVAAKADDLPELPASETKRTDPADDERLIQEIESLCMKCEEQVCYHLFMTCLMTHCILGRDSLTIDFDPILSRSHSSFIPVRALWQLQQ